MASRMTAHQRLRVHLVFAQAQLAVGDHRDALSRLDAALDLAIAADSIRDVIDLLALRGSVHRAVLHLSEATSDYDRSLRLLETEELTSTSATAGFGLLLMSRLAGFAYYMGMYEKAKQWIDDARKLISLAPQQATDIATLEWVQAHLFRVSGESERALPRAIQAAEVYELNGLSASTARVHTLVAEIALDVADRFAGGTDRDAFLRLARAHARSAVRAAQAVGDENGLALARLTQVRYSRLRSINEDRSAPILEVERAAKRLQDIALLVQAVTAHADELAWQGYTEQAENRYREVLSQLSGSDMPTLAIPARRALYRAQEMRLSE
jgi:tetratricopeptide (TPR) repeat protein